MWARAFGDSPISFPQRAFSSRADIFIDDAFSTVVRQIADIPDFSRIQVCVGPQFASSFVAIHVFFVVQAFGIL